MRKGYKDEKAVVIPNGLDLDLYKPALKADVIDYNRQECKAGWLPKRS